MVKKRIKFMLVAFLTMISLFFVRVGRYGLEGRNASADHVMVESVNDGDTITARLNNRQEKIRMIGMDAPEMGQEPWGRMAKDHLGAMIASSSWKVGLEYDVVKRDNYGRLLAYVWTQNGKMANAEMLRDGYAVLFTFPPNVKHVEVLRAAQKRARVEKLVIWGEKGLRQMPVDYRREHPRIN
jgi:micrococcal nuclease